MIRFVLPRSVRAACAALWLPLAIVAVASCHKNNNAAIVAAETSGTLIVTVASPPNVKFPNVSVSGPVNYGVVIAGTDTLIDLVAGKYTITGGPVSSTDEVVSTVYSGVVTGSPANVVIDDTTQASVAYTSRPGTGGLWVASSNGGSPIAAQYTAGELRAGQTPGVSIGVADAYAVIDAAGNLWVASHSGNTISEYLNTSLAASGTPQAAVTISGAALNGPDGLAFDPAGNLWVANASGNTIVEYTAEQLAGSGNPAPAVVISGSALSCTGSPQLRCGRRPLGAKPGGEHRRGVQRRAARRWRESHSGDLARRGQRVTRCTGRAGVRLRRRSVGRESVQQHDLGVQPGTTAAPAAPWRRGVLSVAGGGVTLSALAFDNSGDLWTASTTTAQLLEFTADQVIGAGSQPPGLTLPVAAGPSSLVFNPAPDGLPIGSPDALRLRPSGHIRRHR